VIYAAVVPEAALAADAGIPVEIIWHFQRTDPDVR
jgi:hypothetical protein